MSRNRHSTRTAMDRRTVVVTLALLLVGAGLRLWGIGDQGFWYQEVESVTHATRSLTARAQVELPGWTATLPELPASVLAFGQHPPLYYYLLHVWMNGGDGESWVRMLSVLLSLGTGLSLLYVGRRLFSPTVGLLALLLFMVAPMAVRYAQEAHMAALMMLMAVWMFYLTHLYMTARRPRRIGILLGVLTWLVLSTHSRAFLLLPCMFLYTALMHFSGKAKALRATQLGLITLCAAAVVSPWFWFQQGSDPGPVTTPNPLRILSDVTELVCGLGLHSIPWRYGFLAAVIALLVLGARAAPRNLRTVLCFLVAPLLTALLVSYVVTPVWSVLDLAFVIPFLCLFTAVGVEAAAAALARRARRPVLHAQVVLSAVVAGMFIYAFVVQQTTFFRLSEFREAADWCRAEATKGDLVLVPNRRDFWGFGWYFLGPRKVNPFDLRGTATAEEVTVLQRLGEQENADGREARWMVARGARDLPGDEEERTLRLAIGAVRVWELGPPAE
jgi:4-amino-4-deoxy-L-arabinose transferase-like glycosyltransferase